LSEFDFSVHRQARGGYPLAQWFDGRIWQIPYSELRCGADPKKRKGLVGRLRKQAKEQGKNLQAAILEGHLVLQALEIKKPEGEK
jgi:hypothetical protein